MDYDYNDIIDLPHHVSKHHPQMPMASRAAQFAPFAALTGHHAALNETARVTQRQMDLAADSEEILNRKMTMLMACLDRQPLVTITFFCPDRKKEGGRYLQAQGRVVKIKTYEKHIELDSPDGPITIPFSFILDMDGEMFETT